MIDAHDDEIEARSLIFRMLPHIPRQPTVTYGAYGYLTLKQLLRGASTRKFSNTVPLIGRVQEGERERGLNGQRR